MKPERLLQKAIDGLNSGGCSCAVARGGEILTATGLGVKPIMTFLRQNRRFFDGAAVADRVIGRAAAMLLISGGALAVYGRIMSWGAIGLLEERRILLRYETAVDHIHNRSGTGICPLELAVASLDNPAMAFDTLEIRIAELMREA